MVVTSLQERVQYGVVVGDVGLAVVVLRVVVGSVDPDGEVDEPPGPPLTAELPEPAEVVALVADVVVDPWVVDAVLRVMPVGHPASRPKHNLNKRTNKA